MRETERLKRDLLQPGVELRETHISLVFLAAGAVYKVKKPVDFGFLDFTSLAKRKALCEREVELNRRLAPDVYLGVVPIARNAEGLLAIGAEGEAVEWAVEMRRLPDADSAAARLQAGRLERRDVCRLAERIATFHAEARCDAETTAWGNRATVERNVRENFEQTQESARRFLSRDELADIERFQLSFLREQRSRFEAREAQHKVRDGHGDLRLEHCYLAEDGAIAIIDCIEFNERFRYGDVCADIAFLAMDLAWNGRHDLSEASLGAYARAANDYELYGLVDFYESYRAYVRGKVSALLESDAAVAPQARLRASEQARKYFMLAEACAREPIEPLRVYAVGGVIASGKSTIAEALSAFANAPVIDADRTRKHLAGVAPTTPIPDAAFSGQYSEERSGRVYAELLRRADVVLSSKRSVVLDASFRGRDQRRAAMELAERHGASFLFIECRADLETSRARLEQRAQAPSVSDGRLEVLDAFAASFQPVEELPADKHLRLDTGLPAEQSLATLRAWIER